MIKAIIFDMDGLLIDSEPIWNEAARKTMAKINFELTEELKLQTTGLACHLFLAYCHKIQPWNTPTFDELEEEILEYAHKHILETVMPMSGALDIIKNMHAKGYQLAVASASHMSLIEGVLRRLEIEDFFETWHSGVLEKFTKPHPAVYLATAAKLNLNPAECLAFEDSFVGLQAAHRAGMVTVSVPAQEVYDDPKFNIADFKIPDLDSFDYRILDRI